MYTFHIKSLNLVKHREIPEDFCKKDWRTGVQAVFHCIVCNCDLKDCNGLLNHVKGKKHVGKACDYKRQVLGVPKQVSVHKCKALFPELLLFSRRMRPRRRASRRGSPVRMLD